MRKAITHFIIDKTKATENCSIVFWKLQKYSGSGILPTPHLNLQALEYKLSFLHSRISNSRQFKGSYISETAHFFDEYTPPFFS